MEGELNIKMKYILKFLIFPISVIIMITGCSQDTTTITKAKILVDGTSIDDCLININEDGTVEYISCETNHAFLYKEDVVKEVYKEKTITLSEKNKIIINDLIQKINANEPKEVTDSSSVVEIFALIDDKNYCSEYYRNRNWFYDENVAKLCYKLVELAPLEVGGEMNPLRVPDEYK